MKSRMAILSMLVAGMLLSTTGAGLAVTSVTGGAAATQYHSGGNQGDQGSGDKGGTLGEGAQGGPTTHHNTTPHTTPNTRQSTPTPPSTVVQPTRQLETGAGSGQLPFTGFLAIPVLLGGLALLATGLILRRRTTS